MLCSPRAPPPSLLHSHCCTDPHSHWEERPAAHLVCAPLWVIVQPRENVPQLKVGHGHLSHPWGSHVAVGLAWISDLQSLHV